MKLKIDKGTDKDTDAIYLKMADDAVIESDEVAPGVILKNSHDPTTCNIHTSGTGLRLWS